MLPEPLSADQVIATFNQTKPTIDANAIQTG
jgi:hypothetical protein